MNVGKVSSVVLGNYNVNENRKGKNPSFDCSFLSKDLMDKKSADALKAQVSFGAMQVGIRTGKVEDKPSISATLNGRNQIDGNTRFNYEGFEINSTKNSDRREIEILKDGEKIIQGYISDDLGSDTEILFNVAKHNPEIKIVRGTSSVQLLKGSYIKDRKDRFEFTFPGEFAVYDPVKKLPKKENISFKGTYSSLLCKKDSTVKAVNSEKDLPFAISGQYWEEMLKDNPSIVGLMGGFGTRFANMTDEESNKPSFVMPNGQSLAGAAFDLAKNGQGLHSLENITYLNQVSAENPTVSENLILDDDKVVTTKAFSSDGGAVIDAVINGHIPNDKPLVILNADTITNIDISQTYKKLKELKNAALVIPCYPVSETRAKSFGLMSAGALADKDGSRELISFVEKPQKPAEQAPGAMIKGETVLGEQAYRGNPGIYLFNETVLQNLDMILDKAYDIALKKRKEDAIEKGEPIPTELGDRFSASTFLGNAFVPAVVELCQNDKLFDRDGNAMKTYIVPMLAETGKQAAWDDVGSAEAFIKNCQDIAYETEAVGITKENKYYGLRGLEDFKNSTVLDDGVIFASPRDRENFENKYAQDFRIQGNVYIKCK